MARHAHNTAGSVEHLGLAILHMLTGSGQTCLAGTGNNAHVGTTGSGQTGLKELEIMHILLSTESGQVGLTGTGDNAHLVADQDLVSRPVQVSVD